jgi:hypothetical protein
MRFISQSRRFSVQVRPEHGVVENGMWAVKTPAIYADFWQDDIREHELADAEKSFNFHGRTTEMDTVTPTPIITRLSVFDTVVAAAAQGWDEETRERVEAFLLQRAEQTGNIEFKYVPEREIAPPWPRYNEFRGSIERLIARLREDGYDFNEVLTYEQSQFGLRRPEVIAALAEVVEHGPRDEAEDPDQYVVA